MFPILGVKSIVCGSYLVYWVIGDPVATTCEGFSRGHMCVPTLLLMFYIQDNRAIRVLFHTDIYIRGIYHSRDT